MGKPPTQNGTAVHAVGVDGFEPTTSCSQSKRASQLRYTPISSTQYNPNQSSSSMSEFEIRIAPCFREDFARKAANSAKYINFLCGFAREKSINLSHEVLSRTNVI